MEEIIFPNQIRMFRRMRGKPMKTLASVLGVSLSAISKIEKGYRRIDEEQLDKISKFLDCPREAIFVSENFSQPEVIKAWKKEQDRRAKINNGSGLKTLGAGLRYIRGQKQLTLHDVAEGAKMTLSVYHRIEMGQREVDEKSFQAIAHALGLTADDLQMRIYELDISGALEELKRSPDGKNGVFISKGGYNDLPISRFMIQSADSRERAVPIHGLPQADGTILFDESQSMGSVLCPSTIASDKSLYGVSLMGEGLVSLLPERSVLIVSKETAPQKGDIAVRLTENNLIQVLKIEDRGTEKDTDLHAVLLGGGESWSVTKADLQQMHKVLLIVMP